METPRSALRLPNSDLPVHIFSVSELAREVKGLLETGFPDIWVEGEVSTPKLYPSGHLYFDLKDADAVVSAVMFGAGRMRLPFTLEHGLKVLARGRVSSYSKSSKFQLVVSAIEPRAMGALQLAFEQLKKKLEAEGLFAADRKRPIPRFPKRVGVVTSLQGAAIRDILSVLKRRFAGLDVLVHPVKVQGDGAASEIAAAIETLNAEFPDLDVLLVGRGGGSLEDLWAFNEEVTARAIAASKIPVISCVGHETDFTIADFVADLRAPTPSVAAELVVANKKEVVEQLGRLRTGLLRALRDVYEDRARELDDLEHRLLTALGQWTEKRVARLKVAAGKLDALSPLAVLSRGYSIVFKDGKAVRRPKDVKPGDRIKVRVHEGDFDAEVRHGKGS